MAGGFLGIGVSGLQFAQQQLNTASHNIANVNTEGYSRQQAIGGTRVSQSAGGVFTGSGVELSTVRRIFDTTLQDNYRENLSNLAQQESFVERSGRIDTLLADPEIGLGALIEDFFGAISDMNLNPALDGPRQAVLSSANLLSSQFNSLNREFNKESSLLNQNLSIVSDEVNALAQTIADLNISIINAGGTGGPSVPNDLLDKRDKAIDDLSKLVKVSVIEEGGAIEGNLNILIGNGLPLVLSGVASSISVQTSADDPLNVNISLNTTNVSIDVTDNIQGGVLGGLIEYRDTVLKSSFNQVGIIALGLSDQFNAQHQLGVDLNGVLGGTFFNDINLADSVDNRVIESQNNTGTANLGANIVDVNQLVDSDYELRFDGANYNITRLSDNQSLGPFAALPATVDGFEIVNVSGAIAAGDEFLIAPTRRGGEEIGIVVTDINEIAAANPVLGEESITNIGSGVIKSIEILDTTTTATFGTPGVLTPEIDIQFDPAVANQYTIVPTNPAGAALGPFVFTPGQDNTITINDIPAGTPAAYEIVLSGTPGLNDTFSFAYNANGVGDNRNGLRLAELEGSKTLNNGFSSFNEAFAALTSDVGSLTHEAEINVTVNEALVAQSESAILSVSGVNLDEEAANLIRFQQAYQASAQVISISTVIFDTLIQSVR